MFYYIPLDNKYIVSMNGENIKSISIIADWQTVPEVVEIQSDDIYYHVKKHIRQGKNRGFFNINDLLDYAIAQGEDDLSKLPDKPRKRRINVTQGEQGFISVGDFTMTATAEELF